MLEGLDIVRWHELHALDEIASGELNQYLK